MRPNVEQILLPFAVVLYPGRLSWLWPGLFSGCLCNLILLLVIEVLLFLRLTFWKPWSSSYHGLLVVPAGRFASGTFSKSLLERTIFFCFFCIESFLSSFFLFFSLAFLFFFHTLQQLGHRFHLLGLSLKLLIGKVHHLLSIKYNGSVVVSVLWTELCLVSKENEKF